MDEKDRKLNEIHRMLRWLVIENLLGDKDVDDIVRAKAALNQPDISDILEEE